MDTIAITSAAIFVITFFFILTERIHRTVIGLFGAMSMIVIGNFMGFYHPAEALAAIDFNTIGLLFGMMILVALMEHTGVFQYLGILAAKWSKGSPWLLMVALGTITAVLSMILDNVTTIILIVPVTIVIADMLKINPVPILMSEALLSNIGGTATLIGDPPNIMIGSAAAFSFNDFLIHSLPVVLVAWAVTLIIFRFLYAKDIAKKPENIDRLTMMNERDAIKDMPTLRKLLVVFAITIALFFMHEFIHLPPAIVALVGAALALIVVSPKTDPQQIIERCELSVLLFFASLFIIVGGLEHAGILQSAAQFLISGAEENILLTAIIILWSSAVLSALVDNIPLTVAMIPIIGYLAASGVEVDLLWWALVFGVGFGGNGSPIGSSAGVIVVAKSEKTDHPISFITWIKQGIPTMVGSLSVATLALIFFQDHWL